MSGYIINRRKKFSGELNSDFSWGDFFFTEAGCILLRQNWGKYIELNKKTEKKALIKTYFGGHQAFAFSSYKAMNLAMQIKISILKSELFV